MAARETLEAVLADSTFICDGCPNARGLIELCVRFNERPTICSAEKEGRIKDTAELLYKLDDVALESGCKGRSKDLPGPEVEIPELGMEYCDFIKHCLAYGNFKKA